MNMESVEIINCKYMDVIIVLLIFRSDKNEIPIDDAVFVLAGSNFKSDEYCFIVGAVKICHHFHDESIFLKVYEFSCSIN